jgi:hypothetical protein
MPMGKVSHLAEKLVVIQALPGTPPFDEGTVLWTKEKQSIAEVCMCDDTLSTRACRLLR